MSRADKLIEAYKAQLGEKIGAPVEEIGIYSRPGGMSAAVSYAFSDGIGMWRDGQGKKASGGLPMNVIMALTASELVVFEYKAKGMGGTLKLGDALVRESRAGLTAEVSGRGSYGARLEFSNSSGGSFELDANKLPGMDIEWNLRLVDALAGAPPAPAPPPSAWPPPGDGGLPPPAPASA